MPGAFAIRWLRPADIETLFGIEARATRLLAAHGHPEILLAPSPPRADFAGDLLRRDVRVVVGEDGRPRGFSVAGPVGDHAYLFQLSVDPDETGRGLGSRLLADFMDLAAQRGAGAAALSTFRDVPFNAPFYARRGFLERARDAAPPALAARFAAEVPPGTDPTTRVPMVCDILVRRHRPDC